ncbi:TonB family protein, partial [Myxococcota bacterium]|nr:TonB family protein [Myxococcota bacterium]
MSRIGRLGVAVGLSVLINLATLIGVVALRVHQNPPAAPPPHREAPQILRQAPKHAPKPKPQPRRARPKAAAPAPIPALALPAMVATPDWAPPEAEAGGVIHTDGAEGLSAGAKRLIMTESMVDVPPAPMETPPPRYPLEAQRQGVTGAVKARLLVDVDGAVRQVTILSCDPPGVFDAAASEALSRWRFRPGAFQGQAVPVWVRKTIRFTL